jgi:formylglycine-generating enzyme required for sulfatase activity
MGDSEGDTDEDLHEVTVPDFYLMRHEVTVAEFDLCVTDDWCTDPNTGGSCTWPSAGDDKPINCVDWLQAWNYCQWIGAELPSESRWEYAARNGSSEHTYPWGDTPEPNCTLAVMNETSTDPGCGTGMPWDVGQMAGDTTSGLEDMAGNVREWIMDWYHDSYDGAPTNGNPWLDPPFLERVVRGGGYADGVDQLRAADRSSGEWSLSIPDIGFRCALYL